MDQKPTLSFKLEVVASALKRDKSIGLAQWAKERGIGYSTIQRWLRQSREGKLSSSSGANGLTIEKRPLDWTVDEKWQAVLDCAAKDDNAIASYCREHGIFRHHLTQWKQDFMAKSTQDDRALRDENRKLKEENKQLKRELTRKEKALAETAALITLKKKLATLWSEDEDK